MIKLYKQSEIYILVKKIFLVNSKVAWAEPVAVKCTLLYKQEVIPAAKEGPSSPILTNTKVILVTKMSSDEILDLINQQFSENGVLVPINR